MLNENEACCGSCCFFVLIVMGCAMLGAYIPEHNIGGIVAGYILILGPIVLLVSTFVVKKRKEAERRLQEAERQRIKAEYEANMQARGFVKFVDRHGQEKWGTPQQVREWKAIDLGLRDNFASYSPRKFEKFIARLFGKMGYATELGKYVGDYGADIIARKGDDVVLVQVKKYRKGNNVGAPEVQKALGSMWKFNANKAVFVTSSDFTVQAEEQAKGAPIELWNQGALEKFVEKYLIPAVAPAEEARTVENVRVLFPKDLEGMLTFEEKENYIMIKPRQYLGSENFAKIASIVRDTGGEYISAGKESHFRVLKKWATDGSCSPKLRFAVYVKERKMDEKFYCSVCGKEISPEDSESYDGLCWECWEDQITEESEMMFEDLM